MFLFPNKELNNTFCNGVIVTSLQYAKYYTEQGGDDNIRTTKTLTDI